MRKPGDFPLRLLGIFGGLVVLLALLLFLMVDHSRRELEAYRASLEKHGERLMVEELMPPPTSDEGNGARDLIAAAKELNRIVKEKELRRIMTGQTAGKTPGHAEVFHQRATAQATTKRGSKTPLEEISWEAASANFAALDPRLEDLRRASNAPRLEFHPDYRAGMFVPMDEVTPFLGAAQLLWQQSIIFLHQGNISAAVDNTTTMLRIAEMIGRQPVIISQLITLSITRMAANATWEILHAKDAKAENLTRLQAAWQAARPVAFLGPALRMERAAALPLFDKAEETMKASSGGSGSFSPSSFSFDNMKSMATIGAWSIFFRYSDERALIRNYQSMLDHIPAGEGNWKAFIETIDRNQLEMENADLSRLFSRAFVPSLGSKMVRFADTEAVRRLCLTAISIRRYQLDHGNAAPASLAELIPDYLAEIPLDPFDGKPLRYKAPDSSEYSLYSVGRDGVDDGGNAGSPSGKIPPDFTDRIDIVWPIADKP